MPEVEPPVIPEPEVPITVEDFSHEGYHFSKYNQVWSRRGFYLTVNASTYNLDPNVAPFWRSSLVKESDLTYKISEKSGFVRIILHEPLGKDNLIRYNNMKSFYSISHTGRDFMLTTFPEK